jgi:hypothetical protein
MKITETTFSETHVSIKLANNSQPELATEWISFRLERDDDSFQQPLSTIQADALHRARIAIENQIEAMRRFPGQSA